MPNKIWIVSELYYPEDTSTGYFLTKIAEGLAQCYQVDVLCSQPTYSARGVRAPRREQHKGVTIQRCLSSTFSKDFLLFRIINLATISLSIFIKGVWRFRSHDFVLVVTNPPSLPFLTAIACWLHRTKCLLLVHDVYPEIFIAAGIFKPNHILARLLVWLHRQLYRSVDRVIVLGRDMKTVVSKKLDGLHDRVVVIPNWADVEEIAPDQRAQNPFLKQLGLLDKFVIQYSGNMGRTHGLECLIESAKNLSIRDNIQFVFIGWGAKEYWVRNLVKKANIQNITILPPQPRSDLSNFLNACDIAVISFIPGMAGVSVPSRMYNIMAAGKPIIAVADKDSELAMVVQEEQVGWVVPPNQPDKIVEVILEAQANPERLAEMGIRARWAAEKKYSFQQVKEAYLELIESLGDGQH